jgi:hypothetical protein
VLPRGYRFETLAETLENVTHVRHGNFPAPRLIS